MQRTRLFTYCLIAGVVALVAVVSWQLWSRPALTSAKSNTTEPSSASLPNAPAAVFAMLALDEYAEFIERPLFSQTRRPPVPETVINAPAKPPKPKNEPLPAWKLVGTAIIGEMQVALIWDTRNKRFVRLEPGMNKGGWEIAAVQPEYIVLSKGSIQHEIKLPRF